MKRRKIRGHRRIQEWRHTTDLIYLDESDIEMTIPDRESLKTPGNYRSHLSYVRYIKRVLKRATQKYGSDGSPYWILPGDTVWIGRKISAPEK